VQLATGWGLKKITLAVMLARHSLRFFDTLRQPESTPMVSYVPPRRAFRTIVVLDVIINGQDTPPSILVRVSLAELSLVGQQMCP
jgi:hypothetical protein